MTNSAGKGERQRLHPPFAQPGAARRPTPAAAVATVEASAAELPSIDEFVDDLPLIDDFLAEAEPEPVKRTTPLSGLVIDEEGWAAADWQSYDWSGIASLGAPPPEAVEAHAAWSSTDWDPASVRQGGALEVAAALDEMARRIRSGELSLEQFQGTPPEAAIAALFAALLRTKG
jgi:hypothetical protein